MISLFWKRGVTRLGPRAHRCLALERARHGWWPFSYRLLDELAERFQPSDDALLERLYASMEAGEGVFKITSRDRFARLDQKILETLPLLEEAKVWRIQDVAVSSGITSLEFFQKLQTVHTVQFEASDYYHRIWLSEYLGWTISFDEANHPIQMAGWGMVMSIKRNESWRYFVNCLSQAFVRRFVLVPAKEQLVRLRQQPQTKRGSTNGAINPSNEHTKVREISLFHPEAIRQAQTDSAFWIGQKNGMAPLQPQSHLVRVMNFLTHRHLQTEQLHATWKAMQDSLLPLGILVVGRTRDESDGALLVSAYQKMADGHLRKLWHLDGPWESEAECFGGH